MISNMTKKPEIIIVDNNRTFRQGLIFLITIDNVASVIGKAGTGIEFLELLTHQKPDLVLMDINMPQMDGIEATKKALEIMPDLKIIAFTMFGEEEYYYKMIELGVKGFILKSSGIDELENAIQDVMKGESYFSEELLKKIIINFGRKNTNKSIENVSLNDIETEVMQHICNGFTHEEIAQKLFISLMAVKGYQLKILEKIGCLYTSSQHSHTNLDYTLR